MNKVLLSGLIANQNQMQKTGDHRYIKNRIEVSNSNKKTWFDIIAWNETADNLIKLNKGDMVIIEGILNNNPYQDQSGNKIYKTEVVVRNIELIRELEQPKNEPIINDSDLPF